MSVSRTALKFNIAVLSLVNLGKPEFQKHIDLCEAIIDFRKVEKSLDGETLNPAALDKFKTMINLAEAYLETPGADLERRYPGAWARLREGDIEGVEEPVRHMMDLSKDFSMSAHYKHQRLGNAYRDFAFSVDAFMTFAYAGKLDEKLTEAAKKSARHVAGPKEDIRSGFTRFHPDSAMIQAM